MNHIYIIILSLTAVISSIFTTIFIKRTTIMAKYIAFKNKRNLQRKERLKSIVRELCYEYLTELKNEQIND